MEIIEKKLSFKEMDIRNKTEQIVLHHSGVKILQSVQTIHNYHKNTKGWSGIGYHFYVRKDGKIYRGRPENTVGAHAVGANYNSVGICFEGNFEKETMGEIQLKAGQELVAYLKQKYNISKIVRHKDVDNSSCPGKNFPFEKVKSEQLDTQVNSKNTDKKTEKDRIKDLQKALNKDFNSKLAVDGVIGPATTNAVMSNYLKNFTRGEFVKWTQTQLKRKGYNLGSYGVDGGYGDDTEKAVKKYQKDKGLTVDGCVGIEVVKSLVK